jgi:S-adenosylmethionine-diacylglycerol 3-amino-3-carboxypropyl transferase
LSQSTQENARWSPDHRPAIACQEGRFYTRHSEALTVSVVFRLRDALFRAIQRRHLIYNTCWEDPDLDREVLDLGTDDRVLVITGGGCNALDYLLAGAAAVHAVDVNPAQNALLELKVAAIRALDYPTFWELFGQGRCPASRRLYRTSLRPLLSSAARRFWDRHIGWFHDTGLRGSFYYHGGWGTLMWLALGYWKHVRGLRGPIEALFAAGSLDEQRHIYHTRLAGRLWTPGVRWLLSRRLPLALMGIPERQRVFIFRYPGGLAHWGHEVLQAWMSDIPLASNYFLRVYGLGHYSRDCCPRYLRPEGFARLRAGLLDGLSIHTATVTEYLEQTRSPISRFVLLDHMAWLDERGLAREWQAILDRATPAARIVFRSALHEVDYLDPLRVRFRGMPTTLGKLLRYDRERTAGLHARDRVHMYGSFHVAFLT